MALIISPAMGQVKHDQPMRDLDIGPINVKVHADRAAPQGGPITVSMADDFAISITLLARAGVEIRLPPLGEKLGVCAVTNSTIQGPDTVGRFVAQVWTIRLEPLYPGLSELGTLPIEFRDGRPDWQTGRIPLPAVLIVPAAMDGDAPDQLRPIPELTSSGPAAPRLLRWLGGGLLLVIALAWALSRPPVEKPKSPSATALERLAAIEGVAELSPRGRIESACQVAREFLEQEFGLPATRQTTREFLLDKQTHAAFGSAKGSALLSALLEKSDVDKFAPAEPTPADALACLALVRQLLTEAA